MPRTSRVAPGGMVFHVLNRGVGRMRLFDDDDDRNGPCLSRVVQVLSRRNGRVFLSRVERNTLRANLVERAEDWRWSSLGCRVHGTRKEKAILGDWPLPRPRGWRRLVNQPQTGAELKALRRCVYRSEPYGSDHWVKRMAVTLGLESTLRPRGRPKKE